MAEERNKHVKEKSEKRLRYQDIEGSDSNLRREKCDRGSVTLAPPTVSDPSDDGEKVGKMAQLKKFIDYTLKRKGHIETLFRHDMKA